MLLGWNSNLEAQNCQATGCIQLSIRQAGLLASGPLHMLLCFELFLSFFLWLEESDSLYLSQFRCRLILKKLLKVTVELLETGTADGFSSGAPKPLDLTSAA